MSKPKMRNRDYGYQPNMAEGVVDMESQVTTSGMGMAGKVEKHSEFMQPNNQSYDEMEYLYPGSDYPWDNNPAMNPIGPGRNWPGNPTDCKSLWNKLFPSHPTGTGAFIPNAQDNAALKQYVKAGCPVDYIPNFCCPGVKINGPKEVDGESVYDSYSIDGAKGNCDYTWSASAGRIPGGTFYAPKGPTTVKISVSPFMGDDSSKTCAEMTVKIRSAGCSGETISVPSTQMQVGTSQTLTIVGSVPGKSYTWNIASGGGSMSGATYTAPASNANCADNPTIQLMVGTSVCASVTIAVNAVVSENAGTWTGVNGAQPAESGYCGNYLEVKWMSCAGVITSKDPADLFGTCTYNGPQPACGCNVFIGSTCYPCTTANQTAACLNEHPGQLSCNLGAVDSRTDAQKLAGCCPAQLL